MAAREAEDALVRLAAIRREVTNLRVQLAGERDRGHHARAHAERGNVERMHMRLDRLIAESRVIQNETRIADLHRTSTLQTADFRNLRSRFKSDYYSPLHPGLSVSKAAEAERRRKSPLNGSTKRLWRWQRRRAAAADAFARLAPFIAIVLSFSLLVFFGISAARAMSLLILAQSASNLSLALFSNEEIALSPPSIGLALASVAIQLYEIFLPMHPLASIAASLLVGTLTYLLLVRHPTKEVGSISHELVVVTGCNSGIGYATAKDLLKRGATVIFACRSESRTYQAMESVKLTEEFGDGRIDAIFAGRAYFVELDLSRMASVVECARQVQLIAAEHAKRQNALLIADATNNASDQLIKDLCLPRYREQAARLMANEPAPIHALVCNAGAFSARRELTADGFERNFGANFLAHVLLSRLLKPNLRAAAMESSRRRSPGTAMGGRVVHVSSAMHKIANVRDLLSDPMSTGGYSIFEAYQRSKLAQVVMVCEEQRLENAQANTAPICHIAVHPGNAQTEVSRHFPPPLHQLYKIFSPLLRTVQPGVTEAATTSVYAVAATDATPLKGAYLERSSPVPMHPGAQEEAAGRKLAAMCDELLKPWLSPAAAVERRGKSPARSSGSRPARSPARR